jgi:carbonic anhydrase
MKKILPGLLLLFFLQRASSQQLHETTAGNANITNPDSVISWLKQGNREFVHGQFNVRGIDSSLRIEISSGQTPKAVILACSDSRVAPELIFDKGLGDLFVIRVAGNISDDAVVGSIEYAVEHLHTSLVVVMGHKNCGAIAAAVADLQDSTHSINNHIRTLTDKIQLAITAENLDEKDPIKKALLSNIMFTVSSLKASRPELSKATKKGDLKIVGAVYDVTTGKVEWL